MARRLSLQGRVLFITFVCLAPHGFTFAATVIIQSPTAAPTQQPIILKTNTATTQNLPVILVNSPNGPDQASVLKYQQFDVQNGKVIFNNSRLDGNSVFGGDQIKGNPFLALGESSLIINEIVNSNSASSLNNVQVDLVGKPATIVFANSSGISVNNATFYNALGVNFIAGSIHSSSDGTYSAQVGSGNVSISGGGLNALGAENVTTVGGSVTIDGNILTKGSVTADAGSGEVALRGTGTTRVSSSGNMSLDSDGTLILSPDANINADDITLRAKKKVSLKGYAYADKNILVAAPSLETLDDKGANVDIGTHLQAKDTLDLQLKTFNNTGLLRAKNNLNIKTEESFDNEGTIEANNLKFDVDRLGLGKLKVAGDLSIQTKTNQILNQNLEVGGSFELYTPGTFANLAGSSLIAGNKALIYAGGNIFNAGTLGAGDSMILAADKKIENISGTLAAGNELKLHAKEDVVLGDIVTPLDPQQPPSVKDITNKEGQKIGTSQTVQEDLKRSTLEANKIVITAEENVVLQGSDLNAADSTTIAAGKNIFRTTSPVHSTITEDQEEQGVKTTSRFEDVTHFAGDIRTSSLGLLAGKDIYFETGADDVQIDKTFAAQANNIRFTAALDSELSHVFKQEKNQTTNDSESKTAIAQHGIDVGGKDADGKEMEGTFVLQTFKDEDGGGNLDIRGGNIKASNMDMNIAGNLSVAPTSLVDQDGMIKRKRKPHIFSKQIITTTSDYDYHNVSGSTVTASKDMEIYAGGNTQIEGSHLTSDKNFFLQTQGALLVKAGVNDQTSESKYNNNRKGIFFSPYGLTFGKEDDTTNQKDTSTSASDSNTEDTTSLVGSVNGMATIHAHGMFSLFGSHLVNAKNIVAASFNIEPMKYTSSSTMTTDSKTKGLHLFGSGLGSDSAYNNFYAWLDRHHQLQDNPSMSPDQKKRLDHATDVTTLTNTALGLSDIGFFLLNPMLSIPRLTLNLGSNKQTSSYTTVSDQMQGSDLTFASIRESPDKNDPGSDDGQRFLVATGTSEDPSLRLIGSSISVEQGNLNILLPGAIVASASKDNTETNGTTHTDGHSTGVYLDMITNMGVSTALSGSSGKSDYSTSTYQNAGINVGGQLNFNNISSLSGDGLNISADSIAGKFDTLDLRSEQNKTHYEDTGQNWSAGLQVGAMFSPEGPMPNLGLSGGRGKNSIKHDSSITQRSDIEAGKGGMNLSVGQLNLVGAGVTSAAAAQDNILKVGSVSSKDLKDELKDANLSWMVNGSFNLSIPLGSKIGLIPIVVPVGYTTKKEKDYTNVASVGSNINFTSGNGIISRQDLGQPLEDNFNPDEASHKAQMIDTALGGAQSLIIAGVGAGQMAAMDKVSAPTAAGMVAAGIAGAPPEAAAEIMDPQKTPNKFAGFWDTVKGNWSSMVNWLGF